MLGRGLGLVLRRRRLFWLGALPPLIMSVLFTGVGVGLIVALPWITRAATPFTDDWAPGAATAVRVLVGMAVLAGGLLLMVVSFTALTLALGSPIYDKISESVDAEIEPGLEPAEEHLLPWVARSARQSLTLILISALIAPLLFLVGLIPLWG